MLHLATSESAMPRLNVCVLFVVFGLCACSRETPRAWDRPWRCWTRSGDGGYSCEPMDLSWTGWEQKTQAQMAVAFGCVSQPFDPEADPYDFTCWPVPSKSANRFEDGTMPRFHCVGTYDEGDTRTRQFSCSPYWTLTPPTLQRLGSGWFLWRSLQKEGREREELFAVAQRFEETESHELQKTLDTMFQDLKADKGRQDMSHSRATPAPTADIEALLRQLARMQQAAKERETARTPEEIAQSVAAEEKAWRSGAIVGGVQPGSQIP